MNICFFTKYLFYYKFLNSKIFKTLLTLSNDLDNAFGTDELEIIFEGQKIKKEISNLNDKEKRVNYHSFDKSFQINKNENKKNIEATFQRLIEAIKERFELNPKRISHKDFQLRLKQLFTLWINFNDRKAVQKNFLEVLHSNISLNKISIF